MVYYEDGTLTVRDMTRSDAEAICAGEIAQGWDQTMDKYEMRLRHRDEGRCVALAALLRGEAVGYLSVYPDSKWGALGGQGLPELIDFGVLDKCRRQGIGSRLMDVAEQIAGRCADRVYLGVGLHSGYGSAQRMYVKRGYVPDGSGLWRGNEPCPPYSSCRNDDELAIYLVKELRG